MPAKIIAVANQKGGAGKTPTSQGLASAMAAAGRRPLWVDADPQGHGTNGLGIESSNDAGEHFAHALLDDWDGPAEQLVLHHESGVDVIPNDLAMIKTDRRLAATAGAERSIARLLTPLATIYDAIIIDCPAGLSALTDAALYAATSGHIVAMRPDTLSARALTMLMDQTETLRRRTGQEIPALGMVITQADDSAMSRHTITDLTEADIMPILAVWRRTTQLGNAFDAEQTIHQYAPSSPIAQAMTQLARDLTLIPRKAKR